MDRSDASAFAGRWLAAWNAHDLEAVLEHFADDVVFTSPVAAQLLPATGGVIEGKRALRDYWSRGLEHIPDLRFTIEAVYSGLTVVVINYRNHTGALVCEVLELHDGLVVRGHGTYLSDDASGASGVRA
jgi:ketosteroid isomerase-like protein